MPHTSIDPQGRKTGYTSVPETDIERLVICPRKTCLTIHKVKERKQVRHNKIWRTGCPNCTYTIYRELTDEERADALKSGVIPSNHSPLTTNN